MRRLSRRLRGPAYKESFEFRVPGFEFKRELVSRPGSARWANHMRRVGTESIPEATDLPVKSYGVRRRAALVALQSSCHFGRFRPEAVATGTGLRTRSDWSNKAASSRRTPNQDQPVAYTLMISCSFDFAWSSILPMKVLVSFCTSSRPSRSLSSEICLSFSIFFNRSFASRRMLRAAVR